MCIQVEQLVQRVCNYKQAYTQYGGLRPFGVAFMFAGWDEHHKYQLYMSDPSGNYSGWKATCIGQNNQVTLRLWNRRDLDVSLSFLSHAPVPAHILGGEGAAEERV